MTEFVNRFHNDVAANHGHCRYGPKRLRLTRDEWKERTASARAFAEKQANLKREESRIKANRERQVKEIHDAAQKLAAEHKAAAEINMRDKIEAIRQSATKRLSAMKREIDEKDDLLSQHVERIRSLELILEENGISINSPAP